jgi:hypothetical protein
VIGLGHVRGVGLPAHLEIVRAKARHREHIGRVGELQGEGEVGVDGGTLSGADRR